MVSSGIMVIANFMKIGQLVQKLNEGHTRQAYACTHTHMYTHTHIHRYLELISLNSFLKKGEQARNKNTE
jgi:hypothetical protein